MLSVVNSLESNVKKKKAPAIHAEPDKEKGVDTGNWKQSELSLHIPNPKAELAFRIL